MFWEDFQVRQRQEAAIATEPPIVTPAPAPAAVTPSSTEPAPESTSPPQGESTESDATPAPEPPGNTQSASAVPSEQAPPPPGAEPAKAPAAAATTHGSGSRELRLTADSLTWVRVREGERTVYIGTIEAGQSRVIRVSDGAQVLTGNAGSLKVVWQGSDVGPIGPSGQVRTVILTPDGFSIQAPAPKTPTPAGEGSSTGSSTGQVR
jgi:cytoskeleton protein RodZ